MWSPSIYVFDCSNAGMIVDAFQTFADQHQREYEQLMAQSRNALPPQMTPPPNFKQCIQLAACATNQILPMNSELPADLFTACLTTPIKVLFFNCLTNLANYNQRVLFLDCTTVVCPPKYISPCTPNELRVGRQDSRST